MDRFQAGDLPDRTARMAVGAAVALVLVIILADVISPKGVYLSPMLVVAPALTTAFAGPRLTAGVALVAIAAQMVAASLTGSALSAARLWQLSALVVVSILLIFFSYVRQRRARQLSRARRVAEAAQRVLLRPPPERVGPLRIGWQYLTARTIHSSAGTSSPSLAAVRTVAA